jgi:hypothetical protein
MGFRPPFASGGDDVLLVMVVLQPVVGEFQ